jgi:GTP-binding protein Era
VRAVTSVVFVCVCCGHRASASVRPATPVPVDKQRSLWVAIVGEPNVGKSVLLNRVVGEKVSAVSPKYNTTRQRVLGVRTHGDVQLVFSDTPGFVDPR